VRHHNRQLALSVLHLRKMVLGCYVTSFYAHNAPVNFGGRQQTGKNVFNLFSPRSVPSWLQAWSNKEKVYTCIVLLRRMNLINCKC